MSVNILAVYLDIEWVCFGRTW